MFGRQNGGLGYDLQIKAPRKGPSASILSRPERSDDGEVARGKVDLSLVLSGRDVLKAKLNRGVSIRRFIHSYGDRANDLSTVTECTFYLVHFGSLLTHARHADIQERFLTIYHQFSPKSRDLHVHHTPSTVRLLLPILRSKADGETGKTTAFAGLGLACCVGCYKRFPQQGVRG